jgi:hypothetical protein
MSTGKHNRRWLQFRLRALFVLIAIVAIGCVVVPPVWHWMFPPDPQTEFDALIDRITKTINSGTEPFDTNLSLIVGGGQVVHEDGPLPNRSPPFFSESE